MTDHPRRVTRALLSVSDKSGLIEFARALAGHGIDLVSTGGTAKAIAAAGLKVTDVSELTGFPEMMDGRVKTLHPKVHGGLLAIRGNAEHADAMKAHGIAPIDLLVVNLYPFEATVDKGAGFEECIENIDIGGPAMIRAAAKNHDDVAVVVEAQDYQAVLDVLAANQGATTLTLRRRLAAKAYARTAAYDAAISNWFALQLKNDAPDFRAFGGRLIQSLRYGENPHQTAAFIARRTNAQASPRRGSCRARSCRTTTSTTRMRPMNASPNSIRHAPRPASSSSMPTPAASPRAPIWSALTARPSPVTRNRHTAVSSPSIARWMRKRRASSLKF
jgi:phosphoribosylaminoimidazolecarboxamide formyltransferase/IMP cyclohydrolase